MIGAVDYVKIYFKYLLYDVQAMFLSTYLQKDICYKFRCESRTPLMALHLD